MTADEWMQVSKNLWRAAKHVRTMPENIPGAAGGNAAWSRRLVRSSYEAAEAAIAASKRAGKWSATPQPAQTITGNDNG